MVGEAGKQARFAAAVALTSTAKKVEERLVKDMQGTFDRPSPYTLTRHVQHRRQQEQTGGRDRPEG